MPRLVLLLLALATIAPRARADDDCPVVHVVQPGDTLASIARAYYDAPRRAPQYVSVLRSANGLPERAQLVPGLQLLVPRVRRHRVIAGDRWEALAARYYGDPARAAALRQANDAAADAPLVPGALVRVPYPLRHLVEADESLGALALRYYGDRHKAELIRAFNGGDRLARGELVLVPLLDLVLSPEGERRAAHDASPRADEDALAIAVQRVSAYVRSGRFVEAVALGSQLLERPVTAAQEVSLQRELATSYVALGRSDLATLAFARALVHEPGLALDPDRTSPRVRSALEAARQQHPH